MSGEAAQTGRFLDPLPGRIDHSAGGRFWLVEGWPLRFEDAAGDLWTVPVGFRCDLSSVPRLLLPIAIPWHQSARAGVLHDWLYFTGPVPRWRCDDLYYEALLADHEDNSPAECWRMWAGVRIGGWRAWNKYRKHGARRLEWMTSPPTFLSDGGADF